MNIKITHPLALSHVWSLLWRTLETGRERNSGDTTGCCPSKALLKAVQSKTELFTWGSTGQPMAGDSGPLLPVRPLDKAPAQGQNIWSGTWKSWATCKDTWCGGEGFKADTGTGEGRGVRLQVRRSCAGWARGHTAACPQVLSGKLMKFWCRC